MDKPKIIVNRVSCAIAALPEFFQVADIRALTGVSCGACSDVLKQLLDAGMIEVSGTNQAKGKKPVKVYQKMSAYRPPDADACKIVLSRPKRHAAPNRSTSNDGGEAFAALKTLADLMVGWRKPA